MVGVCPRRLLEGCAHQKGAELGGPGVGRRYHSDGLLLSWVPGRSVCWSVCPAAPSPRLAPERAERAGQGRRPGPHSEGRRGRLGERERAPGSRRDRRRSGPKRESRGRGAGGADRPPPRGGRRGGAGRPQGPPGSARLPRGTRRRDGSPRPARRGA